MRINELLEGKNFNDLDFVKVTGDQRDIDFDLAEDLSFFMNNDDAVYRRHLHPVILKCRNSIKSKISTKPSIFKPAVINSYKMYVKKFPVRELPRELDEEQLNEVCKKMHEEVCQHIKNGKYKD